MEQPVTYCSKCGTAIKPGSRFCPKCGAEVRSAPASPAPRPGAPSGGGGTATATVTRAPSRTAVAAKKPGKKGPIIAVAAAALVLVLVIVGVVALRGRSSSSGTAGGAAEAESAYVGYLDQALDAALSSETAYDEIQEEYSGEDADFSEKYSRYAELYSGLYDEIEGYRSQAEALGVVDEKLLAAGDMIFNTTSDAMVIRTELNHFWEGFLAIFNSSEHPMAYQEYFDTYGEYFSALDDWYAFASESYGALEYPSCIASEWEQYLADLKLNETVLDKLTVGLENGDPLRVQSAMNLAQRYVSQEELNYNRLVSVFENETAHSQRQFTCASDLAEEAHAYVALDQAGREAYEFENLWDGGIYHSYEAIDTIYPSLYNTYDAFVLVKTGCVYGTRKIVVEAEIPGFTQKYKQTFTLDASYKGIYIKPPALTGDIDLTKAKDAQLTVTLSDPDGRLIDAKTFPVTIKSIYDMEWYGDEYGLATQDNILCYLTPESPSIALLKRSAIEEISALTNGGLESFGGYQDVGPGPHWCTYVQAAGIMRALYDVGVRYVMDPYSISGSNQHILLPDDVLAQKGGLCVETALVVASTLQSAGMHAFLIFPPGHAQVAVEVWNTEDYIGEYFLIETTALDASSNNMEIYYNGLQALLNNRGTDLPIQYMSANAMAEYLQGVDYVVDCDDAAVLGMMPFAN